MSVSQFQISFVYFGCATTTYYNEYPDKGKRQEKLDLVCVPIIGQGSPLCKRVFLILDFPLVEQPSKSGVVQVQKKIVTCPWHGWKYSVIDGRAPHKGGDSVNSYEINVVEDKLSRSFYLSI